MSAAVKRKQAETALRLAQELTDGYLAARLKLVAAEFLDEADAQEPHVTVSSPFSAATNKTTRASFRQRRLWR